MPYRDEIQDAIRSVLIVPIWRFIWSYDDEKHALEEVQLLVESLRSAKLRRSMLAMNDFESALKNKTGSGGAYRSWDYLLTGMFISAIARAHARAFHAETQCEMTVTAIALKRYCLRHGKYPATLGELVPEFLGELPVDWMDGQTLRYRQNGETFILWSVGDDGRDDGGTPDQTDPYSFFNGPDIVWPQPASDAEANAYNAKLRSKH